MLMNEDYKGKYIEGLEYQDFIAEKFYEIGIPIVSYGSKKYQYTKGENRNGIEIKYDMKFKDSGNLYIEIAEKQNENNENYVTSGIFRNDNSWLYVIGDYEEIFIFGKKHLQAIYKQNRYKEVETPTSKGFLLPVKDAKNGIAVHVIRCEIVVEKEIIKSNQFCCPECGNKKTEYRNVGRNHWFICDKCKVTWLEGSNLFSGWHDENEEVWEENKKYLNNFRTVN
jgi:ribosomal protein L37AE/L43A